MNSLLNQIQMLTGEKDNVELWFNHFERVAMANNFSNEEKSVKLPALLKGRTLSVWKEIESQNTIQNLISLLKKS